METQIVSRLEENEAIIERGLKTFVEVGNALMSIRDERLYREQYGTFEEYCKERWGMNRNYANKIISSAGIVSDLGTTVPNVQPPQSERQARPLAKVEPEERAEVWQEVVETAPEGKVTARHVAEVVEQHLADDDDDEYDDDEPYVRHFIVTDNEYVDEEHYTLDEDEELVVQKIANQDEIVARGENEILEAAKRIRKEKQDHIRADRVAKIQSISAGNSEIQTDKTYPVVYADPPWRYEHSSSDNRKIENHYPTMSLEEICQLPISRLATSDAVLFLWATSPKLAESIQVIESWGFVYRTCIVWDKERIGMGYYARQQHELLLIATRGSLPVPEPSNRPASVIHEKRDNKHSKKPESFYSMIERMYPEYEKIELFSRNQRQGWKSWGNQADE